MSAEVIIPALMPDINFKPQVKHPLYAFDAVFGRVPDLFFSRDGYKPSHKKYADPLSHPFIESRWYSCLSGSEATKLTLKLDFTPPDDHFVLILSIGIRFGLPLSENRVEQVKYAGAAKILMVA